MLRMVLFGALALSGCSSPVFYTDAVVALAAPEVLEAWDRSGNLWPPTRLDAGLERAEFVSRDLADRRPLPPAVVLGFSVTDKQLEEWKKKFPGIHWATVVPGAVSPALVHFHVSVAAGWQQLLKKAAAGRGKSDRAVALVPESTSAEIQEGLRDAWKTVTGGQLTVTHPGESLETTWEDVFLLDPLAAAEVTEASKARIHTGLGVSAKGGESGFGLRLDSHASQVFRDGLLAPQGATMELSWEVFARKGQDSSRNGLNMP